MLNSIVTIICITLISVYLVLVFQKCLKNLDKRPSKKGLPRDLMEVMGLYA